MRSGRLGTRLRGGPPGTRALPGTSEAIGSMGSAAHSLNDEPSPAVLAGDASADRGRGEHEDAFGRLGSMKDRLEQYILDIETLTAIGTIEEGKLQDALVDSSALEVRLRKAIDEGLIREEQLHRALESRDVIGQAKGILMEREGVHEDEALAMLETISQRTNVGLREVAILLIARTWTDRHPGEKLAP